MKKICLSLAIFTLPLYAQRQELGLELGAFKPASRTLDVSSAVKADFSTGTTFSANYGIRILGGKAAALFLEVPFVASPQHTLSSSLTSITRDVATLYIAPGVRLKFAPKSRVAPFIATGGGWALFEQSTERIDGKPNNAPRTVSRGVYDFGGGVDVHLWRFIGLRGEVRDFLSGNPAFNVPVKGSTQHNVLYSGGFVLKF